jgi:FAD/FMN-containing dehydrogenase
MDVMSIVDDLRSTQSTPVLTPTEVGYDEAARKWGPPAAPDVLVRPTTPEEVGAALRWAAAAGVDVAVRSGGHGRWAPVPGGLLVDLAAFTRVDIGDDDVVQVGGGAVWGDVAEALAPHGLVLSSGDTRSVGVGGSTLGSGVGWLVRSVGLAADQLVGVQLVTADGSVVTASEDENAELFSALRGGGGNFGLATRLDFRATRLGNVVFGTAPVDGDDLPATVLGVQDAMRVAPRELVVTLVTMPPTGPGTAPARLLELLWAGDDEKSARAALAAVLASPGVGAAELDTVSYGSTLSEPPEGPPGPPPRRTGSNGVFRELSAETAGRAAAALAAHPATIFAVRFLGGALGDVPKDATALAWRDAEALVTWIAMLPPDATDEDLARVRDVWAEVGDGADAVCGNFTSEEGPDVVERMYPPETLARLRAVKRRWDPENLFRRNHNIAPAQG